MNDHTQTDADAEPDPVEVLDSFGRAIGEANRKVTEGRVYDEENEQIRIQWLRAYTDAVAEYRELADEVDAVGEQ